MRRLIGVFLIVHGLMHLMGFAKAFRLADLPQLTRAISPLAGAWWLIAALLWAETVRTTFTNAGQTIRAELGFNDVGELMHFWSDDRTELSSDGRTMKKARWSTPVGRYRAFGPNRLGATEEAHGHQPEGEYAYVQVEIDDVRYNMSRRQGSNGWR